MIDVFEGQDGEEPFAWWEWLILLGACTVGVWATFTCLSMGWFGA